MLSSLLSVLLAGAAAAADPAPRIVERVLAVVDARPVLLSELRVAQQVRGEEDEDAALEALIDEHLMFAEALRLPQAALTEDEEAAALASIAAAGDPGRDPDALRRMARRQATILKYVDFRFRPQVRVVSEDAAEKARLEAQELDTRIEAWVKDLRAAARIRYNRVSTVPASR
jgi:hypothetical protein